jgi:Ca-activated chloride channel family protein
VYTIGFGTETGEMPPGGQSLGDPWGGGGGGWFRRGIDEDTLREVASLTGGRYYAAASASELQNVFASLPTNLVTREERLEISVMFAALGALLAAVALALSLLWNPLP